MRTIIVREDFYDGELVDAGILYSEFESKF